MAVSSAKPAKPAAKRVRSRSTKRSAPSPAPVHDEIARRAYFIHLEEGSGDELENWLRAERELSAA